MPSFWFDPFLEKGRKRLGEVHRLVGPDSKIAETQVVHRIVGNRIGLIIVSEGGHEHIVTHPDRQFRMGCARGQKRNPCFLKQRRARHDECGVGLSETCNNPFGQDALRIDGRLLLVGLAIRCNDLDLLSQKTAGIIDLFCGKTRAGQRRTVQRGHAPRQVVERAELDCFLRQRTRRKDEPHG